MGVGAHPAPPAHLGTRQCGGKVREGGCFTPPCMESSICPLGRGSYPLWAVHSCPSELPASPSPQIPAWKCWGQGKGEHVGGSTANVAPPLSLLPARPLFHPGPAHPVFLLQSCWHGVNIAGWVSETCAPPHYPAPWGTGPSPTRHGSQTPSNTPLHPQTDQEVAFADSSHLPWHFQKPLPTPPHFGGAGESADFARGSRTHSPPPGPARAPLPARPARTPLTWKPAQLPPTSLLRIANRTAGVGPPAGHSSASAALAESRGPNVRRGRTGGWLFWGGDSSDCLGRAGCLRAGAGQMLYF